MINQNELQTLLDKTRDYCKYSINDWKLIDDFCGRVLKKNKKKEV